VADGTTVSVVVDDATCCDVMVGRLVAGRLVTVEGSEVAVSMVKLGVGEKPQATRRVASKVREYVFFISSQPP
jgi:hypothetical protein